MNILESILESSGPTRSSQVVAELVSKYKLSKPAARQRVSRGTPNISRLKGISLPRGEKFIYLKKDFGSPIYWDNLISVLQETKSAYGLALGALSQRGEITLKGHFSIICGSPLSQSKHLASETILENLLAAKLVSIVQITGVGECIALSKGNDFYYESLFPQFKARMIAESILLNGIKDWIKKIGLASYEKVALRNDQSREQPKVGTFHWDLTAPSYVGGLLTSQSKDLPNKPGFIACDICLGEKITARGLAPFIYKCNTLRSLKRVGRCLQIFIADQFEKEAFILAKKNGVLPITPETLFGKEVSEGLNYLLAALQGLTELMFDPDMFNEMFSRLSKIEGAVSNLRGVFFELIVAEACRKRFNYVRMNYILTTPLGEKSETDVFYSHLNEIVFIECKGYSPHAQVPDSEVEKWLNTRVPRIFKAAKAHPDWKNTIPTFEFWTTGKLSDKAITKLEKAKKSTRETKYKINYKGIGEVTNEIKAAQDESILKSFEQNFLKDPVSSIKLRKPKFDKTVKSDEPL